MTKPYQTYRVVRSKMGDPIARPLWAIKNAELEHIVEDFFRTPEAAQKYILIYLAS